MRFRYETTNDYDLLTDIFKRNEIELEDNEFTNGKTNVIKAFAVYDDEMGGRPVGAIALATRMDHTIINGIAVDPEYRRERLASGLLKLAMQEARAIGVQTIWIIARAPLFFASHGFEYITQDQVPQKLFDCLTCSQYNKICFPKLMKYNF